MISISEQIKKDALKDAQNDVSSSQRMDRILLLLKNAEFSTKNAMKPCTKLHTDAKSASSNVKPDASNATISPNSNLTDSHSSSLMKAVKSRILQQEETIKKQTTEIEALNKKLTFQEEEMKNLQSMFKTRLEEQETNLKVSFEEITRKNLTFINTLLSEKTSLLENTTVLSNELKSLQSTFKQKIVSITEGHKRDLKMQRDSVVAAEKLKRDEWISQKTKTIKDQTIKGLEPEIQRMISQHKIQMDQAKDEFNANLNREKNLINEACLNQVREQMNIERQKACEEEREFARLRYQKQIERDELEYQQQKRQISADFDEQKRLLQQEFRTKRQEDLNLHKQEIHDLHKTMDAIKSESEEQVQILCRKHSTELNALKEKLQIEKEQWQDKFMAKQEAEMRSWEKQLKERLLAERDAELENIVMRLESETSTTSEDIHKRYKLQLEKQKNEFVVECRQLRDQHDIALDKVLEVQVALQRVEDQKREIQRLLLQEQNEKQSKEILVQKMKSDVVRLSVSEVEMRETIETEFRTEIIGYKKQIEELRKTIDENRASIESLTNFHKEEIARIRQEKEDDLQAIEERVNNALKVKEEMCQNLRDRMQEMSLCNQELNEFVEKQLL